MSATIISHPGMLGVRGVSRVDEKTIEVHFDRQITDDQFINFWIAIKYITVASVRPDGWEPVDKSVSNEWVPA